MSKWYKASELERLKTLTARDGVNGLPDNHVITVSERVIEIDERELVQNNVSTDTYTLVLDAEWDDITPIVIFSNSEGDYKVAYENGPTKIPAAVMAVVGAVDVSVFGLDSTGEVRVVTKAAPNTMNVVESGKFVGQVSADDISLLGQILAAAEAANKAAENANSTAESAGTTVEQLKESVQTFLSQSQTSVDNAVSSAGTATSAANTAAQKANTAADNADNSADAADTAAASAKAAAARAENAYTTLQPVLSDISVSGNQPRATLSGNVMSAKDAWPAKPLGIKIKGKTRQNLWVNQSRATNGITIVSNDDGSVTLSGTSTSDSDLYFMKAIYTIKPNTAYTLSVNTQLKGFSIYAQEYTADGFFASFLAINDGDTVNYKTATTSKSGFEFVNIMFRISPGATVSGTYRIMLNEGPTAEPWCPPGLNSVDELSLVTAGKNLLQASQAISDIDGWSNTVVSDAGDGWIKFGLNPGPKGIEFSEADQTLLPGKYVLSFDAYASKSVALNYNYWILPNNSTNISFGSKFGAKYPTLSTSQKRYDMQITVPVGIDTYGHLMLGSYLAEDGVDIFIRNIQLELGSTATDYEPPNVTTTPLPEVELRGLPNGTCDELVIEADGTCEVERRLDQKTIDAEHPISVVSVYKASGTNLPYATTSLFAPFASADVAITSTVISTSWPYINTLKSRGVYRTWNSTIFVDERFADKETAARIINEAGGTFVAQVPVSTEPQTPVTLPLLPAPTFNVYPDSQVPSDTSVEYVRDINIALADLEAQIADLVTKEAANV